MKNLPFIYKVYLVLAIGGIILGIIDLFWDITGRQARRVANIPADTFVGITTDGNVRSGLYGKRNLSINVSELNAAGQKFVESLSVDQRSDTLFEVDATEWRKWSNVDSYQRAGVSLSEMTEDQKAAAWALLNATFSDQGMEDIIGVMHLNRVEGELLEATDRFNEDLYWFTVMGTPGDHEWGFQLDGHHLVMNVAVHDEQVTMTPAFLGSEPTTAPVGTTYAGKTVLQAKQNTGLALVQSLNTEQLTKARIAADKTSVDLVAGAFADNVTLEFSGLRISELNTHQKSLLTALINTYTGNLKPDASLAWMEEINSHLNETWFAWIGDTDDNAVFYYRIYSPVLLIEFEHQRPGPLGRNKNYSADGPTREHIHAIIRSPNGGDYGDILRQHLEQNH